MVRILAQICKQRPVAIQGKKLCVRSGQRPVETGRSIPDNSIRIKLLGRNEGIKEGIACQNQNWSDMQERTTI